MATTQCPTQNPTQTESGKDSEGFAHQISRGQQMTHKDDKCMQMKITEPPQDSEPRPQDILQSGTVPTRNIAPIAHAVTETDCLRLSQTQGNAKDSSTTMETATPTQHINGTDRSDLSPNKSDLSQKDADIALPAVICDNIHTHSIRAPPAPSELRHLPPDHREVVMREPTRFGKICADKGIL